MASSLLDIWKVNKRSLSEEKLDAIRDDLVLDHDTIMLTETNLPHDCIDDLTLNGYHNFLRKDCDGRPSEGIAMYDAKHLGVVRVDEFEI